MGLEKNYKKIMGLEYRKTRENILYFLKNNKKGRYYAIFH